MAEISKQSCDLVPKLFDLALGHYLDNQRFIKRVMKMRSDLVEQKREEQYESDGA